jgi:hypothetical protein
MDDFLNYSSANQAIANQARARHEAVTSSLLLPDEWRLLLPDNGIDLRVIVGIPHPAEICHGRHSAADPPVLIAVVALAAALAMAVLLNRARLPALLELLLASNLARVPGKGRP